MALTRLQVFVLIILQWFAWTEATGNATIDDLVDQSISNLQQIRLKYKSLALISKLYGRCGPCKPIPKSQYCDCTMAKPKEDCLKFREAGYDINGIYRLKAAGFNRPHVFCDQTTLGGGWTTFLRRQDGSVNFTQNWKPYKHGFGELTSEFWLGNEIIHGLTEPSVAPKKSELLINMRIKGQTRPTYAKYDTFQIGDEASKYILQFSGASGNASQLTGILNPDTFLTTQNNMKFSTYDQDNDKVNGNNCSTWIFGGVGWWFSNCGSTVLTNHYPKVYWRRPNVFADFVEMKVRRKV
ncbi:ficolin-1-like [Clytia hemisphaerica]|uniref:Fibrinogen C-terminal domain-containing protein n=1 Tax=Clytia hemisphaerica TaxID=252671 RepID=A0A7M6DPK0_9CNID